MLVNAKCDCKCKLNIRNCNSNQKWKNETCLCKCKTYPICKKDYSWNPKKCISENGKQVKRNADDSQIVFAKVINDRDSVSANVTNIVPTNVTSTVSINYDDKKVIYKINCYILYMVLLVIILLFIIAINCYHYAKHR